MRILVYKQGGGCTIRWRPDNVHNGQSGEGNTIHLIQPIAAYEDDGYRI